jgi:hypothetical protein
MSYRKPWKAAHEWRDEDEDIEAPPIRPLPAWFKPSLRIYASLIVQADELERAAMETDDRDECRRLRTDPSRAGEAWAGEVRYGAPRRLRPGALSAPMPAL